MIQTPPSPTRGNQLVFYGLLVVLWLLAGLALIVATVLAGGVPHTHFWDWPFAALRSLNVDHLRFLPWHWVGATTVRSTTLFWASLVVITVAVLGTSGLGAVLLRGGIPSVFPVLAVAPARSRWAHSPALQRARMAGRGSRRQRLLLGTHDRVPVSVREGTSLLVFGAAGSGKSASICAPLIQEWEGCVLAVSAKRDLVDMAAGVRQRRGQVEILDPADVTGLATCTWSPVETCRTFDRSLSLASWLVDTTGRRGDEVEPARRLLTCLLYAASNLGVAISEAVEWLDDTSGAALVRSLLAVPDRDPRAMGWLASVVDRKEAARAAFSTAGRLLWMHFGQALTEPAGRSIFRPRELLVGGDNTLFIAVPPLQQEHTPGLTTSLLLAVLAEAENLIAGRGSRRLPRPLLVALDDCVDSAPVDQILDFLSVTEDVGITLVATCTDAGQWQTRFAARATGLVDRARSIMFLGAERGANDAGTMELMHRLVRRQLLERAARRHERDGDAEDEDLLTPEAAGQLGLGRGVLIAGQAAPALLWLRNSYRDAELQQRQLDAPFIRGVTRIRPGRR